MKLFWAILAIYITLLPLTSVCRDRCGDDAAAVAAGQGQESHSSEETESCSPFCACSCCGVVNHLPPSAVTAVTGATKELPLQYGRVTNRSVPFVYAEFWQPPRRIS